jgi:hypothetical protein
MDGLRTHNTAPAGMGIPAKHRPASVSHGDYTPLLFQFPDFFGVMSAQNEMYV